MLVLGGGSTASTDAVESVSRAGAATSAGHLPRPRSDLVAATVGGRTYVLGGYDGSTLDPSVLETTDGSAFKSVASSPGARPLSRRRRRGQRDLPLRWRDCIRPAYGRRSGDRPGRRDRPGRCPPAPTRLPRVGGRPGRPDLRARRDGGRLADRPRRRLRPGDPGIAGGRHAPVARVERRRGRRRRLGISDRGPRQGRDPTRLRGPAHAEERPGARAASRHVHHVPRRPPQRARRAPPRPPRRDVRLSVAAC